ncbi:MAG: NAD(P)(+) transhydrogenase (Re/Si-specific) subunit beta [Planctomycetota bacterium]
MTFIKIAYLVSAVMFMFGLKFMAHPRTAVRGNRLGALAMAIAVVVTLFDQGVAGWGLILLGGVIGAVIGNYLATTVEMTDMPQLVALFNGFGGAASVLVAGAELIRTGDSTTDALIAASLSGIIGAVTFWGSLVAYGKLQGLEMFKNPFSLDNGQLINLGLVAAMCLLGIFCVWSGGSFGWYLLMAIVASVLGVLLVVPIGGADMPVVIALLNSYSGLAASATGFVINNNVLIISGALVGASGLILTQIMCKAMNRSLTNVLFGVMDGSSYTGESADEMYATVRRTSADDVAMILDTAQRVVFIPGYGMAVAQAQHAVRDLANMLIAKDIEVEYAIHPVAGRMPGHMNVLLAEADVPYEQLKEMDDINPTMDTADVAIVIGANDVVNPLAKTDPESPIAGMPIIDVDKARTVVVIKRSLSPGFAKIPNPLFAQDNTLMFFGDGKAAILEVISAMKEL